MAYVLWRVFMKKYSKVRLGIHRSPAHVTPTGRQIRSFDDSSWKASEEVPSNVYQPPSVISVQPKSHKNDPPDDFSRTNEVRKSKTKRVKNYLKKCKNAIANSTLNRSQCSDESTSQQQQSTTTDDYTVCDGSKTSWYVKSDTQDVEIDISDNFMTVVTIDKSVCEFEKCTVAGADNQIPVDACASEICAEELTNDCDDEAAVTEEPIERIDDEKQSTETSSLVLTQMQDNVEDVDVTLDESSGDTRGDCTIQTTVIENKNDVASLVDSLLGPIYPNFSQTRSVLVRQARDLLVCEYLGNIVQFEKEFCIPASILLKHVKQQAYHKNKRTEIVATTSDQQAEIKEKVDQTASSTSASQNNVTTDTVHDERVACAPDGWPLSLGSSGIILHLGSLAPALLRHGDCYVCIRGRSAPGLEVALVWRKYANIFYKTLAEYEHPLKDEESITCTGFESALSIEMAALDEPEGGVELPELLQTLLVSVERAIERIPLDDLAFPCPQCHQFLPLIERTEDLQENLTSCSCQCSCQMKDGCGNVLKKDTSMQTSPMFEIVGSIPHIDSDEDDEGKNQSSKSSPGSITKRPVEIIAPKNICELPEKFLMSGINLPGTHDVAGRPIVLCDAACIARAGLSRYDVTTLLLYYSSIPSAQKLQNGLTFLVLAETSEEAALDVLDKAMVVLTPHVNVDRFIIWRPSTEPKKNKSVKMLKFSKLNCYIVSDEAGLEEHIAKDQAPASCGGSSVHDQLEWVEFFKELEPFIAQCHMSGRALAASMSEIRSDDTPVQVTRRHLSHQHRQLTRALTNGDLQKLRREGFATLERLDERAQWLTGSEDVQTAKVRARRCLEEVHRVARRLEQIADQRRERLKELARLRALEEETTEVLQWLRNVGDEKLKTHNCLQRTAVVDQDSVKQQEQDFEQFYFIAMRYIDKGGDLIEEANQCADPRASNLKDMTQSLKLQLRTFGEALEETRERLEDTTRYFQLVDRTQNGPVTDNIRDECYSEMVKLAKKLGNDKMIDICETLMKNRRDEINNLNSLMSSECPQHIEAVTSTPVQSTASQGRRRSVSSFAYIYKCNHHAAGFPCNCWDSDEGTISQKLKNTYVQSLQTQKCVCGRDNVIRQSSLGLGDIKEVRESAENLLDNENSGDDKNDSGLSGCGRCDSVSTRKTVSRNIVKKRLHRSCSCQYFGDMCTLCSGTESSSGSGSNGDHSDHQPDNITEGGSDGFHKSGSDELEDTEEAYRSKTIPPISVNSHLHCHSSNIHLPTESSGLPMDPKTHKTLLLIMREMIQTERDYVKSLDYIIENYIPELLREDIPQALRGQRNVVFGNVEKIYEFHSQHFLRELEQCAENPLQVGQCFLRHEKKFYLYALYNKNKPKSDSLMSEYGTIFFKAKQVELEDKMDLASYLLKPVQRMGKYALLLQQLMKACPPMPIATVERDAVDMEDLKSAEQMVRFQLRHGNDLLAMDSLRDCDVNLKEQGRLLRQNEFLVWEGRGGKKSLRQVFLFEDLILFSKARRFPDRKNLDLYIYKNSIKMTDIGLTAKIGDSTTKFEIWFRKRKPNDTFTLQSMSEDIKKAWTEEISQLLWKQAMKNREVRLQEMSSMGIGNKPCLDIRPSADQISDRSISIAQLSKTAPKFRNSIAGPIIETCRSIKRPHSIISVSSVSSGSTSSGGSNGGTLSRHSVHNNVITYDPSTSPKSHHRSTTLNSQCSMESGIIADLSMGSDDCNELSGSHWPLQKSNSQHSNASSKSNTIASSPQTEEPQVTLYHVPDELSINL